MPYKNKQDKTKHDRDYRSRNRVSINEYQKQWTKKNPKKRRAIRLKHLFGLTLEDFDSLLSSQKGLCPICLLTPKVPTVDHSHKTGKVRGIVCREHNTGLGMLGDSVQNLTRALKYLKKHGE